MRIGIALFKYFPHGGLQRDGMAIAAECLRRGHEVTLFALEWHGPRRPEAAEEDAVMQGAAVEVADLPSPSLLQKVFFGHRRQVAFRRWLDRRLRARPVDLLLGLNKMPGLDLYYAADSCYLDKAMTQRGALYRLSPRFRHLLAYEAAVFGPAGNTRVLALTWQQLEAFGRCHGTSPARLCLLSPGLGADRRPAADPRAVRAAARRQLGIGADELLLLAVGSGFVKKGLDRSLRGLAALPQALRLRTRLVVLGRDHSARFVALARRLGVLAQVSFLGGRDDVPTWLCAGDLLLHPALDEAAGIVLLEAMVAGCPVLVTDCCGYAGHVATAAAGRLLGTPFRQSEFDAALRDALADPRQRSVWREAGLRYGRTEDLWSLPRQVADSIDALLGQVAQAWSGDDIQDGLQDGLQRGCRHGR